MWFVHIKDDTGHEQMSFKNNNFTLLYTILGANTLLYITPKSCTCVWNYVGRSKGRKHTLLCFVTVVFLYSFVRAFEFLTCIE